MNRTSTKMMPGFGNHFSTEAVAGALPVGQNSPQKVPFGLYPEQLSGTSFTEPRTENRRSWLYRLRPAAMHGAFSLAKVKSFVRSAPFNEVPATPNRLRWSPLAIPTAATDFIDGLVTVGGSGDTSASTGIGIHLYATNRSMKNRAFFSADGEMLIVPEDGALKITTELGVIDVKPLEIVVIPRGVKFRVELHGAHARGYIAENYGPLLRLPDLGPIGANGLANSRDFETPEASFEDIDQEFEIVQKFQGQLWTTKLSHSPFDVVAWHGNLAPYKYDLTKFNTINTVSFDHIDPSIFTVLTSPTESRSAANFDFVIFPPRWMVAEHTFRPPWFHRNVASEYMGLIQGQYDAKEGGFVPGGGSLHNCMNGHGPDRASYEKATAAELKPVKLEGTMAFMFETRTVIHPTKWALETPSLQLDYDNSWSGFKKATLPK